MATIEHDSLTEDQHPIDIVESLAENRDWDFDRMGQDQIAMAVEGSWRTYALTLAWSGHDETLRLICTFEFDPPATQRAAVAQTVDLANDACWIGNFVSWPEQSVMVYRYGLTLAGGAMASAAQIDAMIRVAVAACERFYPAFQLVGWGETPPADAVSVAIAEAYGRA